MQIELIVLPNLFALGLDFLPDLQLCKKESREHIAHDVTRANVNPRILIDLPSEEPAPVGSFFAQNFGPFGQTSVVNQQCSALTAGDIFRLVEALGSKIAKCAQPSAAKFAE